MRRIRVQAKDPATPATSILPELDPALRDTVDPDPVVEEMVERLRGRLSGLAALDEFDRPVAWRSVVRLALGPTLWELKELRSQERSHVDQDPEQMIVLPDAEVAPARPAAGVQSGSEGPSS